MKLHTDSLLHSALAGATLGAFLAGVLLFAPAPSVGLIAFVPSIAMAIITGVVWAIDRGLFTSIEASEVDDADR